MESTAKTYFQNNEEELRDQILATLNTHYDNATGETFRKIGKTDIQIQFDNKAAYIAECKIWSGKEMFSKAIQQLLNYSTWKDIKISIIVFNKKVKNFKSILEKINEWVLENTKSTIHDKANLWNCEYYRDDMEAIISISIIAFDLYVDQSQFCDNRKSQNE